MALSAEETRVNTGGCVRRLNGIDFFSFFSGDGLRETFVLSGRGRLDRSGVVSSFRGGTLPSLRRPPRPSVLTESFDFRRRWPSLAATVDGRSPSILAMWTRQMPSTSSTPAKYASSVSRGSVTSERMPSISCIARLYSVRAVVECSSASSCDALAHASRAEW
jgi:hypothetical protein